MTASVANLLESFDGLSEPERHEAVTEILRRIARLKVSSLNDDSLTEIAAMTFEEFDAREPRRLGRDPAIFSQ